MASEEPDDLMENDTSTAISAFETQQGARKRKKMTSDSSGKNEEVWKHVDIHPNNPYSASCKYCGATYNWNTEHYGTGFLWLHVKEECDSPENPFMEGRQNAIAKGEKTLYSCGVMKGVDDGEPMLLSVEMARKLLVRMIIVDEFPFSVVEGEGFISYSQYLQPQFKLPSKETVARDCMGLYVEEKAKLRKLLKQERLSLTTEVWTSTQNLYYLCLTAHWIDGNWNYQKRILNFCLIPDHKGETIAKTIESCMAEWGIDRILVVTVDNARANNACINRLQRRKFCYQWKDVVCDNEFMHMRCCAHIVNLIVQDGLIKVNDSIVKIRNAVRYIRSSVSRGKDFEELGRRINVKNVGKVALDVETRWNSTYLMLESALKYEVIFDALDEEDAKYREFFFRGDGDDEDEEDGTRTRGTLLGPPGEDDWNNARVAVKILKRFYKWILKLSGSTSVTANEFFHEFVELHSILTELSRMNNTLLSSMWEPMLAKFKQYWGDYDSINGLLYVAIVLDPRYKLKYVRYCFVSVFGDAVGDVLSDRVESLLRRLYEQYLDRSIGAMSSQKNIGCVGVDDNDNNEDDCDTRKKWAKHLKKLSLKPDAELTRYLGDDLERNRKDFDILSWWKLNSVKFPTLSRIARDVLAIPMSTVSSESAFNTGRRILDPYRSSLSPTTIEALLCVQNWLQCTPTSHTLQETGFLVDPLEIDQDGHGATFSASSDPMEG